MATRGPQPPRGGFSLDRRGRGASQGRSARESGVSFQEDARRSSAWYEERQLGMWVEIPLATYGKPGALKHANRHGTLDFVGTVRDEQLEPTPLMFDCKVTTGHRTFTLAHEDARERQRAALQIQNMQAFVACGGIAGFLCLDRDLDAVFWLSAEKLAPLVTPASLIGATRRGAEPDIVIRDKGRGLDAQGRGLVSSPNPWRRLPTVLERARGAPPVPVREVVVDL